MALARSTARRYAEAAFEIAERDDSDVRHCGQGIEQGTATAIAAAYQSDSQDVGPSRMNLL